MRVGICRELPVAELRGNEKNAARWKIWRRGRFSTASSACSSHLSARAVATSTAENLQRRPYPLSWKNVKLIFYSGMTGSGNGAFALPISLGPPEGSRYARVQQSAISLQYNAAQQQQSMSWTGSVSPAYTLYGNPTPYTLRLKQDRPTLGLLIPHALVKTFAR